MRKIYGYELHRLVFHKFFLGILAVSLFYGWQVLSGETIRGVAHTAPFSPWSFGCFLGRTVPVICVGELFFLTFYVSKAERRASAITNASPAPEAGRALARCGAALTVTALLLLAVLGLGLAWCLALFRQASLEQLLAAALCALVPPVLFCLGAGWLLGRLHPALLYVFMGAAAALSMASMPAMVDFSGIGFFSQYPLTLGVLDPDFQLSPAFAAGRMLYSAAGLLLLGISLKIRRRRAAG